MRASLYPDGHDLRLRLRSRERALDEKWRRELIASRYASDRQDADGNLVQSFRRETGLMTFARRTHTDSRGVDAFLFGADAEHAVLNAPDAAPIVGPHLVDRRYAGSKIGFARRALVFDTLTWLIQKQVIVDVPLGIEWEALAGFGYEAVSAEPASFLTGWAGRMWSPRNDMLYQVDFWGTGYRVVHRGNWDAASARARFSGYMRSGTGVVSTQLAAEKLVNPDPDVRALANIDITAFVLPSAYRLAEEAYAASAQKTRHLANISSGLALDAAGFLAGSIRRKSPKSQTDHTAVTVLGAGLRLIPTTPGSGSVRLDVMYPLLRSDIIRARPVFVISLTPWLEASRQREDPRLRQ
jgi:hypothetical protein